MVSFAFKDSSAYSIEIQLDIANFDTARPLLQEKMMRKGVPIIFDQQEQNISKTYFVKISQDWYDERDKRIQCRQLQNEENWRQRLQNYRANSSKQARMTNTIEEKFFWKPF